MSRPRQRPTRDETRARLLAAAAEVFVAKGIAAASIEDICTAADFSRGAFYSNFSTKDDLVLALLDTHMRTNMVEIERLYETSDSPMQFLSSMESDERRRDSPIGRNGILHMELVLYAIRDPENRPRLAEQLQHSRRMNRAMIERIIAAVGKPYPLPIEDVVTFIMALDTGLDLHRLVEPDVIRDTQFRDTVLAIHQLWVDGGSSDEA